MGSELPGKVCQDTVASDFQSGMVNRIPGTERLQVLVVETKGRVGKEG